MEAQCEYLKAVEMLVTGRHLSSTVLVHVSSCIVYYVFVSGYECATQKRTHTMMMMTAMFLTGSMSGSGFETGGPSGF